jgi:hypothetical protein
MRKPIFSGASAIVVAALVLAGCTSTSTSNEPMQTEYSGFLPNYSDLTQATDANGETILRYINPKLTPANYHAVIIEPVIFYPKAEPTEQVSQATLDQIRGYTSTCVRQAIASRVQVVDTPGPGVGKIQIALTGVASTAEGLKPWQYVPQAFVISMAVNKVEGAPQQAKLLVEVLGTDSVSGEVLAKVVRTHTGEALARVASNEPVVTFDSVKPILDEWCDATAKSVAQYIKPR